MHVAWVERYGARDGPFVSSRLWRHMSQTLKSEGWLQRTHNSVLLMIFPACLSFTARLFVAFLSM